MEHLHPDDAFEQLKQIYTALTPGGLYICTTPNRLTGPHDVSKYFDETAAGFRALNHASDPTVFGVGGDRVEPG
jgi:predicted SAM-dependent methyltransferase